jgi:thiamine monophosphate kinase
MQIAFTAGEDFELLFTLSRETSRRLQKNWKRYSQTPVTKIGKVVRGKSKITIYGHHKIKKIKDWKGWKHF